MNIFTPPTPIINHPFPPSVELSFFPLLPLSPVCIAPTAVENGS